MNPNDINDYNPAEDDNQGVAQLLSQAQKASGGVPQEGGINPVLAQGPEPVKEEVNESDTDANGVSTNLLAEEDVEDNDVQIDSDDEE